MAERARETPAARVAAVVAMLIAIFAVRVSIEGLSTALSVLYLVPTVLAGLWFGPLGGLAAGLAGGLLYALGATIGDDERILLATVVRLAIFGAAGYVTGLFASERQRLRSAISTKDLELKELQAVRDALIPTRLPPRPSLDIASCFVPAESGVGGDFFLVAGGPDDATIVVVGDVVGRGLDAARRASFVSTSLATSAPFTDDPLSLLQMANHALIDKAGTTPQFVTAACLAFKPQSGVVSVALAGHPPPLRLDTAVPLEVARPCLPLGVGSELDCLDASAQLEPGEGILLYTDGLVEARRRSRRRRPPGEVELYGEPRLRDELGRLAGASPRQAVDALRASVEEFSGQPLDDDICLVALRHEPSIESPDPALAKERAKAP